MSAADPGSPVSRSSTAFQNIIEAMIVAVAVFAVFARFARAELCVGAAASALFILVPMLTDRTMFYFTGAMSEPWMLLAWSTALVLVARMARMRARSGETLGTAAALGAVLAAAMLARTQSAAVVVGVIAGAAAMRIGWRAFGIVPRVDRVASRGLELVARCDDGARTPLAAAGSGQLSELDADGPGRAD